VGPLIAVDRETGTVNVGIQLEKADTLGEPFEPVGNPFHYSEQVAVKAFFLLRSGPVRE